MHRLFAHTTYAYPGMNMTRKKIVIRRLLIANQQYHE